MKNILIALILIALTGCATSNVKTEVDSFTGATMKKAMIRVLPDLDSVVLVYLDRNTNEPNGKVALRVLVNYYQFRFQSGQAFGIKADDKLYWFTRKPGVDEVVQKVSYQLTTTAEFEPVDIQILREIASAKVVSFRAKGVNKNVESKFAPSDLKVLSDFVK